MRCRDAAERDYTIQPQDIDVLKVLYLINYINDVKPCIGNIAILMADRIDADMKEKKGGCEGKPRPSRAGELRGANGRPIRVPD